MGQPVVHFEIIGKDPDKLRGYYGDLFGWEFDITAPVAEAVSQAGSYGFVDRNTTSDGTGIPGGVDGGVGYDTHAIFYVGVPDVAAALQKAESLGGTRRMGPERNPGANLVVGHFTDPRNKICGGSRIRATRWISMRRHRSLKLVAAPLRPARLCFPWLKRSCSTNMGAGSQVRYSRIRPRTLLRPHRLSADP